MRDQPPDAAPAVFIGSRNKATMQKSMVLRPEMDAWCHKISEQFHRGRSFDRSNGRAFPILSASSPITSSARSCVTTRASRIVQGTLDWMANGLQIPHAIEEATAEYRQASDVLGRFFTDNVRAAPGERVQATEIYQLFVAWARETGAPVWKQHGFANAMRDRGKRVVKASNNYYLDIELTKALSDYGVVAEDRSQPSEAAKTADDGDDVPL